MSEKRRNVVGNIKWTLGTLAAMVILMPVLYFFVVLLLEEV